MAKFEINGIELAVPGTMLNDKLTAKLSTGEYEAEEARAVQMRSFADHAVLELGAGIGYITALCARKAGAQHVVTVEANPELLPVIRRNLARNGLGDATVLHGAVAEWDADGHVDFDPGKYYWAGHVAEGDTGTARQVQVPSLGLSNLLDTYRPKVVVMDVEGAEMNLFSEVWPGFVNNVILELHPNKYPDTAIKLIVDCMSASGLTYDPGPSRGRILGFRRLRHK